jgi:hypothetical protein
LSSLTRSLVMLHKQSGPVVEVPASSNVWSLLDLVPAQREAHTAGVIKIISLPAITIILPISREQHLLKVLASLELLECERDQTSLLAFDDGDADLFLTARNLVEQSKLAERLCVLSGSTPRSYVGALDGYISKARKVSGKRSTSRKPSLPSTSKRSVPGLPPTASSSPAPAGCLPRYWSSTGAPATEAR